MKTNEKNAIDRLELMEIFNVDSNKTVNRWGFFAKQDDGNYTVFKPQISVFKAGTYDSRREFDEAPGFIQEDIAPEEIKSFVESLGTVYGIPLGTVSQNTPSGWYYDSVA